MNSEAKLLIVLGLIVLLGGGFLFLSGKGPVGGPPPTPKPPDPIDARRFDQIWSESRHTKGDPKARYAIIEFADFECPSCRRAYASLVHDFGKKISVQFAFRHRPLPNHENAMPAAVVAEAAAKQGKFWPMYDALMQGMDAELNTELFETSAKNLGLKMEEFRKDYGGTALRDLIRKDTELADELKVESTPTFLMKDREKNEVRFLVGGKPLLEALQGVPGVPTEEEALKAMPAPKAPSH